MVAISDMQDVLIAFVSVSVLGYLWFHPAVFGNLWRRHCRSTVYSSNLDSALVLTFVSQFVMVVLLKFLMT
jgi:hypothetical protein